MVTFLFHSCFWLFSGCFCGLFNKLPLAAPTISQPQQKQEPSWGCRTNKKSGQKICFWLFRLSAAVCVCVRVCVSVFVCDCAWHFGALFGFALWGSKDWKRELFQLLLCCCISSQRFVAVVLISKLTYFRSPFVLPFVAVVVGVLSQLLSRQAKWSLISHRRLGRRHMRGRGVWGVSPNSQGVQSCPQLTAGGGWAGAGEGAGVFSANDWLSTWWMAQGRDWFHATCHILLSRPHMRCLPPTLTAAPVVCNSPARSSLRCSSRFLLR